MIPVYTLAENSRAGSRMIEIVEAVEGSPAMVEPAFLIPHRKDYYLFVMVRKGGSRHWVDSVPYTLKKDSFYFTIPSQVHLKEEMRPMQGIALRFSREFLQLEENKGLPELPLLQNPAGGHELRLSAADKVFVEDVLARMLKEFRGEEPWKNQMLMAQLRVLVIYLSRLYVEQYGSAQANGNRQLLNEFLALVEEHYRDLHAVAAYASMLHISPGHLNEKVKEQSGRTASQQIHARLLVEAKRQLLHTELSVKEMAEELGFEDAAYFSRWFKRMAGNSPGEYRAAIREMYR